MRKLVVPGTDLQTSRFIFGTGNLIKTGTQSARRRSLEVAVEHGFLHFDTAPYYGFGVAERDLASVLKTHSQVQVTTKVGIYSVGGDEQPVSAVLMRKICGKAFPSMVRPIRSFDLERARRSLEGSLRRLSRDCIDLYLLHEPELDQLAVEDWVDWLQSCQRRGQIRHFGLSHMVADLLAPFLSPPSPLVNVIQVRDSWSTREADVLNRYGRPLQITFGYVSSARASGRGHSVDEILQRAMKRNPHGPIIVSTTRIDRIAQYARLLEAPRD